MRRLLAAAAPLLVAAAIGCSSGSEELVVSAAASMREALEAVGESFEAETGVRVVYNFGGSRALARQIELGAPVDAAVFAGESPMDRLAERDLIAPQSRLEAAINRLVVIARAGASVSIDSLEDLTADSDGKIAIADPQLAPAGEYARAALQSAGIWKQTQGRLVPAIDVRAAAAAVAAGNARFAIVYASDVRVFSNIRTVFEVPEALHPPITYPAAAMRDAGNLEAAKAFVRYLGGVEAGGILLEHGFGARVR